MTRGARPSAVGAAAQGGLDKLSNVPAELRDRPQWVGYRLVPSQTRPGKTDKIPIDPHTGSNASSTNATTWGTFEEATAAVKRYHLAGVGFVFSEADPYTGVDLDGCIDDAGEATPWALGCIGRLDSYTERSQSGAGLHVIVRAVLPPGGRKRGAVEMYDSGRFFATTGDVYLGLHAIGDRQAVIEELHAEIFGVPEPVKQPTRPAHPVTLADADLLAKAQSARNGDTFTKLWQGNATGHSSHSEADLALAGKLLFWTGGDVNRADSLFRRSGLYRAKWDERHYSDGKTYGEATLHRALSGMTEFYSGNGHGSSAPPSCAAPVPDEPLDRPDAEPSEPGWMQDGAPVDQPFTPPARPAATPKHDLSECPPLPESAQLDPALGLNASLWLDAYIDFSRQWAPGAYDGFHEGIALWVLSAVAARRVKLNFGGERFSSLYIANVARSSLFTKSTAHHIGSALLNACGLSFLLAPDEATPQALLFHMSVPPTVTDWDAKTAAEQKRARLALAFAGQKGWDYDEFGSKVSAMMRDSSAMTDFRGILRRFDDAPAEYVYVTVGRGENRLTRPYLALLASMPPANMAPYAKRGGALWHDGFWARFAFVAPGRAEQPPAGEFPEGERIVPPNLTMPLRAWHDRLGVPDVDVVQRKDMDGKPTRDYDVNVTARPPEVCTLGAGVREAFYRYYSGLRGLAAASDNTDLDANYSRFAEKALRVAILLASLENRGVIELRHWARAQEIAERWRQSLHNLYAEINRGQDEEGQREDRVIEIMRRLGRATPNQVHQYAPDISTTAAKTILENLTLAGVLQVTGENRKHNLLYAVSES